jgi:hypothetical protein
VRAEAWPTWRGARKASDAHRPTGRELLVQGTGGAKESGKRQGHTGQRAATRDTERGAGQGAKHTPQHNNHTASMERNHQPTWMCAAAVPFACLVRELEPAEPASRPQRDKRQRQRPTAQHSRGTNGQSEERKHEGGSGEGRKDRRRRFVCAASRAWLLLVIATSRGRQWRTAQQSTAPAERKEDAAQDGVS